MTPLASSAPIKGARAGLPQSGGAADLLRDDEVFCQVLRVSVPLWLPFWLRPGRAIVQDDKGLPAQPSKRTVHENNVQLMGFMSGAR